MPIFGHLEALPIRNWDESRLAINAIEMLKSQNYLVTTYEGTPDLWNTKPPLMIWLQVAGMKIFGIGELAVRLPSALAAMFTCLLLFLFGMRFRKDFWFAFIVVIVLVTSSGYINVHAVRTGDYDALLTLFTTLSALAFFTFLDNGKNKYLYLFFLATSLAVLTKSTSGLLMLPGLVLYAAMQKQLFPILKSKHFYLGMLMFLSLVLGYYGLRELYNPGYVQTVLDNEFGGRFLHVIEGHQHGPWFYIDNFIDHHLAAWHLLIPCGIAIGLLSKEQIVRKITLFSLILCVTYTLIITVAQTKLYWYDVPLYPFLSIIIAVAIHFIYSWLAEMAWFHQSLRKNVMPLLFLFLICLGPYQRILDKTYKPVEHWYDKDFYEIGYYLRDAAAGREDVNNKFLLFEGFNAQNLFYLHILNEKGISISMKDHTKLVEGDVVIAHQGHVKDYMDKNYELNILQERSLVRTCEILGPFKDSTTLEIDTVQQGILPLSEE